MRASININVDLKNIKYHYNKRNEIDLNNPINFMEIAKTYYENENGGGIFEDISNSDLINVALTVIKLNSMSMVI